jgi:hypothetical protein
MHENKRRFIRILTKAEMTYRIVPELKICGSITTNLSRGGLRFFVNQFIPQSSMLRITVTIKEIPFSFETLAQVKWIKNIFAGEQFELGVEFQDPPREAIKQLQRFIDYRFNNSVGQKTNSRREYSQ